MSLRASRLSRGSLCAGLIVSRVLPHRLAPRIFLCAPTHPRREKSIKNFPCVSPDHNSTEFKPFYEAPSLRANKNSFFGCQPCWSAGPTARPTTTRASPRTRASRIPRARASSEQGLRRRATATPKHPPSSYIYTTIKLKKGCPVPLTVRGTQALRAKLV